MTRKLKNIILSVLSVLIIPIILSSCGTQAPRAILPDGTEIQLELAITPEERQRGLMFRKELAENSGVLFIQEKPMNAGFWMKNTLIPLDIIFIDENNKIVNIEPAVPCPPDTECPLYKSASEVLYILELNLNTSKKHNLQPGSKLELLIP